jgi:hypothetical protein
MRSYLEAKDLRAQKDSSVQAFFSELASIDIKVISAIYAEGKDTKTATGEQLKFWTKAESLINKFRSPKWVDAAGQIVAPSGILSARNSGYDSKGNKLTDHHMIASAILQDQALLNSAFTGKRMLADNYDVGIHIELPTQAYNYLHLFEKSRLVNSISEEDRLFSRHVEKMVLDWMLKKHAPAPLIAVGGMALAKGAGGVLIKKGALTIGKSLVKGAVKDYAKEKAIEAAKNGGKKIGGQIMNGGKKIGGKIKGFFKRHLDSKSSFFSTITPVDKSKHLNIVETPNSNTHAIIGKIKSGIKKAGNGIKKGAAYVNDKYGDQIKKAAEDAAKKGYQIGKDEAEKQGKAYIENLGKKGGKRGKPGKRGK